MKRLLAWASTADDRLNPVAVKEFRQAVQSRWVMALLLLFLALNLGQVAEYVMLAPQAGVGGGQAVFLCLLGVLLKTCFACVPLYTAIRFAMERNDANIDLLFVTTITPGAVVRGKYVAAMALTLMLFSASMPFMVLTYLLQGIDLPTIFLVLAFGFAACASANALGVFVGAVPGNWLLRGAVYAGALVGLYYLATETSRLATRVTMSGVGIILWLTMGVPLSSWSGIGALALAEVLGIGLLYVLAVAALSPALSNRMLWPRLYISAGWAITGAVLLTWSWRAVRLEPLKIWVIGSVLCFCVLTLESLGERDAWTPRVRRTIPRNRLLRLLAFLSYTGSAGGVLWCILLFAVTMLTALACAAPISRLQRISMPTFWHGYAADFWGTCAEMAIVFGFVVCYCLMTASARSTLLRRVPTALLSGVAVLLGGAAWIIPYIAGFFMAGLFIEREWDSMGAYYLVASPLVLANNDIGAKYVAVVVLVAWLALCVLLSAPWVIGQWRRFVPYEAAQ